MFCQSRIRMNGRPVAGGLLLAMLAAAGCGDGENEQSVSAPVEIAATNQPGATQKAGASRFEIDVVPVAGDLTEVEVIVKATEPGLWKNADFADEGALKAALSFQLQRQQAGGAAESLKPAQIIGKFSLEGETLRFRPAFSLLAGETYVARFFPAAFLGDEKSPHARPIEVVYTVPRGNVERPRVTAIYPSGNIVPANHLKFYIQFSEPMQRNGIFEYFRLIDLDSQQAVPRPFRHVELWSKDNKQLTLWFHPGRQKRGVNLNVEIGPVLRADGRYRMEINGDWQSEQGLALGEAVVKRFRSGRHDSSQPAPATWILSSPRAGSTDFLGCDFHEPLDWALLQSELAVEGPTGSRVAGRVELGYGELSWEFHPRQPWKPGTYHLVVGHLLEDLAGNSVGRPFEVDVKQTPAKSAEQSVSIEFVVGDPSP